MKDFIIRLVRYGIKRFKPFILNDLNIVQILSNVPISTIFPHKSGIFISDKVVMGENCIIYQGVTIGAKGRTNKVYPVLGNNVIVYANACIIGNVKLGDNVVVGAGCVVTKSFPSNSVLVGNPVRRLK